MTRPELLAPAGNLEKLKTAVLFGADAVYVGGREYSLRAAAGNFDLDELQEGAQFAHERGSKVYLTLNAIARNSDLRGLADYAKRAEQCGIDAAIVADPGVMRTVLSACPSLPLHVSTQANNLNYSTCAFWREHGAKRVVLARELTLPEIAEIRENTPSELELEAFVHGAVCVCYSGRCLLSSYFTGRDGNRGDCAQPCRWEYELIEPTRPQQRFSIAEDERGSFIFNSRDLCLIGRIPELISAGVDSFKIEGRMKSELYVATTVAAYRAAIDSALSGEAFDPRLYDEVCKVSHREYFEGFLDDARAPSLILGSSSYIRSYEYSALVLSYDERSSLALCLQKNKFRRGDILEALIPGRPAVSVAVEELFDEDMQPIESTPHAAMKFYLRVPSKLGANCMLRKKTE